MVIEILFQPEPVVVLFLEFVKQISKTGQFVII